MDNIYLGGFSDMASAFSVTAQNVQTQTANMVLAKPISLISYIVVVTGVFFCFYIPAMFIVKGLISCVPIVRNWVGEDGGGRGGLIGYIGDNWKELIVGVLFALNAATGLWLSELSLVASGAAAVVQKISNASWGTSDDPASIKQFKDDVKVFSDSQEAQMYESYLKSESNMNQQIRQYVQSKSPSSTDMNYQRLMAAYTATVCRLQILSNKLTSDNYGKSLGISNPDYFKRHLQADSATSNDPGAFNKAFIIPSMVQSFGVSGIPSGSN